MGRAFVLFLLFFFFLLAPAFAGTIPAGLAAAINLTNFTFAADLEADTFSARDYGIAINDSYLDVNTTYFLTVNITNFTLDVYNFTANSTTTVANPTSFTAKMRNPAIRYNLKVNGVYSQEVLTDSYGNATFSYNTWGLTPARFLLTTCLESWSYTQWSTCSGGTQSRIGTDANACGTAYNISEVVKSCYTGTSGEGGGSGGGGSFSQGTPSMKSLAFSFPGFLKILATVLYTLPEPQNVTVSYPASISLFIPPAPGLPYVFMEIVPTFNSSRYLNQAQIDFRVDKTWYSKNEIVPSSTAMLRYDGRSWRSLPTVRTGEDTTAYAFAANTTSLSLFAITGVRKPEAQPTTPTVTVTTSPTSTGTPAATPTTTTPPIVAPAIQTSSRPLSWWALPIVLLSILVVVVYLKKSMFSSPPVKPGTEVSIKGVVTCHTRKGFEITDGTGFILVQYKYEPPPVSSWVIVEGTFSGRGDETYIAASSVKKI